MKVNSKVSAATALVEVVCSRSETGQRILVKPSHASQIVTDNC